jgi:DNA-binding NarL/FixJ family response regulator
MPPPDGLVSPPAPMLHLLIVEDQALVREGLVRILSSEADLVVSDAVGSITDAVARLEQTPVDVVLLDVKLDGEQVVEHIRDLRALAPHVRVLVVTALADDTLHARALTNGACGIVLTSEPSTVLVKAIRKVAAGEFWVNRAVTARMFERLTAGKGPGAASEVEDRIRSLTPRERDVVRCLSTGATNQGIAAILGISEKSVRNTLSTIFDKLLVHNRLELLLFATRHHLDGSPTVRRAADAP